MKYPCLIYYFILITCSRKILPQTLPETELKHICDALRDLIPFVQVKKREKHTGRSVNFSLQLY